MQRRADVASQLARRLIRLVAHRAQELPHSWWIARHLPGDVGLHQHTQPVARADILQPRRRRAQAQIDGDRAFERRRQLPGKPGLSHHTARIAETGDHARFARGHHDYAGSGDRRQQDQSRNCDPQLQAEVMIIVILVIIVIIVVLVCEHR